MDAFKNILYYFLLIAAHMTSCIFSRTSRIRPVAASAITAAILLLLSFSFSTFGTIEQHRIDLETMNPYL